MKNLRYFKIFWHYIKDEKMKLFLYAFFVLLNWLPGVFVVYLWGYAIEALTVKNFSLFALYLISYEASEILFYSVCFIPRRYYHNYLEVKFMKGVSKDLYHKINNLPTEAFEDKGVGELVNRLYTDPDNIMSLLAELIHLICRIVVAFVIVILTMTISYVIVLELLLLAIIMGFLANYYYPKIKKSQEEIKTNSDEYVRRSTENIANEIEIKTLGIKKIVEKRLSKTMNNMYDKQMEINKHERLYYSINNAIFFIIQTVIFITCGHFYVTGVISLGAFMVMEGYIWRIDDVVESMSNFGMSYNKVIVSLKRIKELLENEMYPDETFGNMKLKKPKGKIKIENLYFQYKKNNTDTLKNLNLELVPNKKIAIVGKSGNGKSTIFNALLRLYPIKSGNIYIDDIKIEDLTEESLRNTISVIRQEPCLFHMSIMDNFRLVDEKVSLEKVRDVCKKAFIDDYIMSLPDKYDTIIGEGGINLSGGEKQRIAIARTLLRNTKIILFDEATSSLDNESQEYIKKTIDDLVKDHTIIIIAHRLSTIIDADIIHVINKGRLVGSGTHRQLLKKNKIYQTLYQNEE